MKFRRKDCRTHLVYTPSKKKNVCEKRWRLQYHVTYHLSQYCISKKEIFLLNEQIHPTKTPANMNIS